DRNPAHLAGMRMVVRGHHPVFGVPSATCVQCFCESGVYTLAVAGMNEAPRLAEGHGQCVVSMDLRGARVAIEATASKIGAECTGLSSIERQLKAHITLFESCLAATPL